ncbi:uncharacterized protein LOC113330433 [Papaver somniferum]|uniref:uncharacterized protein LOC113330433 n=1 Tax=Papaver somniferum TaxID=3469 RepID=UPI000E7055CD|nr:uncharacterized protein LOC113330433 [Papaver somniferum]
MIMALRSSGSSSVIFLWPRISVSTMSYYISINFLSWILISWHHPSWLLISAMVHRVLLQITITWIYHIGPKISPHGEWRFCLDGKLYALGIMIWQDAEKDARSIWPHLRRNDHWYFKLGP